MTRSDATLCSSLVKQTVQLLRQKTPDIISPYRCPPNSPVDPETRLTTEFYDWCRNVCTLYKTHVRPRHQRLDAVHHWHMGRHITKHRSSWSVVCMREGKRTSHWTSGKLKPALFRANTLHNRLFQSHQQSTFHRSHFKANEISLPKVKR